MQRRRNGDRATPRGYVVVRDSMDIEEQKRELAEAIVGTADSPQSIVERRGLTLLEGEDLDEILSDEGVEHCEGCDWWFRSYELDENYWCDDCSKAWLQELP